MSVEDNSTPNRFTLQQEAFFKSESGRAAKAELTVMEKDPRYNTLGSYSAKLAHDMPFVKRHMKYLSEHPKLNPDHYLSNLKLMTKIKR